MATPYRPEQRCAGTLSRAALLHELSVAYPEVSGPGVAQILDRAYLAAKLGTGTVDERIVAVLARDRLELLRARAAAARRAGAPAQAVPGPDGASRKVDDAPRDAGPRSRSGG